MKVFQLQDFPLNGKKVFVRTNYDVIVKNNKVVDETKILASIPTLKFLLAKQCTVIIG
ncbi:phosphoglycerate kinase, partial [Candidatus Woesearchaeota archaeon]|nr:phosphoglycerate kinase [Candidatus Woesearchaeota archaeon]